MSAPNEISERAASWPFVRLDDVCEDKTGSVDPAANPETLFGYVDISSVDNTAKCIVETKQLLGKNAPSRARQAIRAGDVLVATTRPNLNAVALVGREHDGQVASTGFCVLRAKPGLLPEFLFLWVQSPPFVEALSALVQGALYPAVSDRQVREQTIPLPSLPEQHQIVARLNAQLSAAARARVAVEQQWKAADCFARAVLLHECQPSQIKAQSTRRLGDVVTLLPSKSVATAGDALVPVITSACLSEWGFRPAGIKPNLMHSRDVPGCIASDGEVLVARSNTPELVGRAAMVENAPAGAVAADLTIRLSPGPEVTSRFLAHYLGYLFATGYWRERAGGASGTMKKITREQIVSLEIPVPSRPAQEAMSKRLSGILTVAQTTRDEIAARLKAIESLPVKLLGEAFAPNQS